MGALLQRLVAAMRSCTADPNLYWLVFNGTVRIYEVCRALMRPERAGGAIEPLAWCALCLEGSVPLLQPRSRARPGRPRHCYEATGQREPAQAAAAHALEQLAAQRALDRHNPVPPKKKLVARYEAAERKLRALKLKYEWLGGGGGGGGGAAPPPPDKGKKGGAKEAAAADGGGADEEAPIIVRGEPIESLGGDAESQLASLLEARRSRRCSAPRAQGAARGARRPRERAAGGGGSRLRAPPRCDDRREHSAAETRPPPPPRRRRRARRGSEGGGGDEGGGGSGGGGGDAAAEGDADGGGDAAAEAAAAAAAAADEAATAATTAAAEAAAAVATAEGALPSASMSPCSKRRTRPRMGNLRTPLPSAKQRTDRLVAPRGAAAALAEAAARGGTGALTASRLYATAVGLGIADDDADETGSVAGSAEANSEAADGGLAGMASAADRRTLGAWIEVRSSALSAASRAPAPPPAPPTRRPSSSRRSTISRRCSRSEGFPLYISASVRADAFTAAALLLEFCAAPTMDLMDAAQPAAAAAKAAGGIGAGTLTLTLEPKTQEDGNKLAAALEKLAARDPGFRYSLADAGAAAAAAGTMDFSERFSKTAPRAADFRKSLNAIGPVATLEGEGELHLQLVCARLAREFRCRRRRGRSGGEARGAVEGRTAPRRPGGGGVSRATMAPPLRCTRRSRAAGSATPAAAPWRRLPACGELRTRAVAVARSAPRRSARCAVMIVAWRSSASASASLRRVRPRADGATLPRRTVRRRTSSRRRLRTPTSVALARPNSSGPAVAVGNARRAFERGARPSEARSREATACARTRTPSGRRRGRRGACAPPIAIAVENRLLDEFAHDGAPALLPPRWRVPPVAAERAALLAQAAEHRVAARREAELAEARAVPPNPTPSHAPRAQLVYRTADAICVAAPVSTRWASLTRSARSVSSQLPQGVVGGRLGLANNTEYRGAGDRRPAAAGTDQYDPLAATLTVAPLPRGMPFVLATAAYDDAGKVVGSIGATSAEVVTTLPLPRLLLWAYLARGAAQLGCVAEAAAAAAQVERALEARVDAQPLWGTTRRGGGRSSARHCATRRVLSSARRRRRCCSPHSCALPSTQSATRASSRPRASGRRSFRRRSRWRHSWTRSCS